MAAASNSKFNVTDTRSRSSSLTVKRAHRSKKSKSNVEIPKVVKQRGLYVEKKVTNTSLNKERKKSKSPPRRDKNSFLYTALTILSKPSAATQFPDLDADNATQSRTGHAANNKPRRRPKCTAKMTLIKDTIRPKARDDNKVTKEVKRQYRSRILNEITDYGKEDNVTVLQPKREMVETPSVYSAADASRSDVIGNSIQDILEKRLVTNDDSDDNTVKCHDAKADKGLYNFFVDVLENTFSVYNVNVEEPAKNVQQTSSVKFLEIDENVAEKLKIQVIESTETIEENDRPYYGEHFYIRDEGIAQPMQKKKTPKAIKSSKKKQESQRKIKEKSNNKSDLLNILKEQLSQTSDHYEPENIYQALKQMVRNKRKRLRFENVDTTEYTRVRRKNIIDSTKDTKTKQKDLKKYTNQIVHRSVKTNPIPRMISNHSLKVYDYDQVAVPKEAKKAEPIILLTHNLSGELRTDFHPEVLLRYPDSDTSFRGQYMK